MLRLMQYNRDIKIVFNRREILFTTEFIRALAIAFFIHISAFLLFSFHDIEPPQFSVLTPINVNADVGSPTPLEGSFISTLQVDQYGLLPQYILGPEISLPEIPQLPKTIIDTNISHRREEHDPSNYFSQIEKTDIPVIQEQINLIEKEQKRCDIHIAGTLADHTLQPYDIDTQHLISVAQKISGEYSVIFSVKVEDRNGRIFWHTIDQSSGVNELDTLAETIIKQLQFESSYNYLITEGNIEFNFNF